MSLKQQIDADLKTAMLSGDKVLTTTLRGIKSAILYAEVAGGSRDNGLTDEAIVQLLTKEAKKRQESADFFTQGGNLEKAKAELTEKTVVERYLPTQMTDDDLFVIVDEVLRSVDTSDASAMGKAIGMVKQKVGATADGARIANAVRGRLNK